MHQPWASFRQPLSADFSCDFLGLWCLRSEIFRSVCFFKFRSSGNIRCASVESGRKLNLLWLKQKEHVLACDGNKILRVASVPGTAGLNSVSNIAEPGFSVYISQLLLVGSVVRQNLPKGHRRHFFHILPSSRLGQRVLLYFQSLIKSLVWRRCHAYLCISHFPRGKQ